MNLKQLLVSATMLSVFSWYSQAQQPYSGCWHPEDIREWNPETDPDAKFNRSTVKLAERFKEPSLIKANQYQFYEGQICNSTILFKDCGACPSQDAENFYLYNPTYWQYMDKVVYWAGSAGEGIICPPSAPMIDMAHMNGVKILGQIFFPPSAFGGNVAWPQAMLTTKEGGRYVYAKKLYEIAKYCGFDGWFINQETPGGGVVGDWAPFIKDFNKYADEAGDMHMEIQWYNASQSYSSEIMKTHVNTSQFLEYGSASSGRSQVNNLMKEGFTKEQALQKLYCGVQCVNGGLTGTGYEWRSVFGETDHGGSLDLFCPEERIWKDNIKSLVEDQHITTGPQMYAAQKKTFRNEEIFWVNNAGDPTDVSGRNGWPGASGCVLERSVIQYKPFVTAFSTGLGKHRFVNGEKRGTQDWSHRGMQNIMPTWRWWIENNATDNLSIDIDWDNAYNFGTSLKVTGKLSANADHLTRLYKTMISVESGDKFQLVYQTNTENSIEVKLGTTSAVDSEWNVLSNPSVTTQNGWTVAEYDLSALAGKTVYIIALNFKSATEVASYTASLGQLGIIPDSYAPAIPSITNVKMQNKLGENGGDFRIVWDVNGAERENLDHINVYLQNGNGTTLVGQTRGEGFYIPKITRVGTETFVNIILKPVSKDLKEADGVTYRVDYPEATAPVVYYRVSNSYPSVGDKVTIEAVATGFPYDYKWDVPEGLEQVSVSEDQKTIVVKCLREGEFEITSHVSNAAGVTDYKAMALEVNSAEKLTNVALHKKIDSFSGSTNETESPENLIDGDLKPWSTSSKWCNIANESWAIIDLEGLYNIYKFKTYDCKHNESGANFNNYRVYVSTDKVNWTLVLDETGVGNETIKEDYIAPTKARYVKFNPYDDNSMTIRIWEFEVYGKDAVNLQVTVPGEVSLKSKESKTIEVAYDLNGDVRNENFACTVTSGNENYVKVGNIEEDIANSKFYVTLIGGEAIGTTKVMVTLNNGTSYKERAIAVQIDNPDAANILLGRTVELRQYHSDYNPDAVYDKFVTEKLTDGDRVSEGAEVIETESSYKEDIWAVFKADDFWNIAKVKIFLPNNNQSGKTQIIRSISVNVSNNGKSWTRVTTIENPDGETEYIFPDSKECAYLGFGFDVMPYQYVSIAEIEAFEQSKTVPVISPVVIGAGFTDDVVAEAKPSKNYVTQPIDSYDWTLFSEDIQVAGSLPNSRSLVSKVSGIEYQLADYSDKNVALLRGDVVEATLEFAEPQKGIEELYFLATSAGEKNSPISVVVNYADGETSEVSKIDLESWHSETPDQGEAIYGLGKILTQGNFINSADEIEQINRNEGDKLQYRLFEKTLSVDYSKTVESVTFTNKSSYKYAFPVIFAISKKSRADVSGIDNKITVDALNVYPNPVSSNAVLTVEAEQGAVISLVTLQGVLVHQIQAESNISQLSMKGLVSGTYILLVKDKNGVRTMKVIVR